MRQLSILFGLLTLTTSAFAQQSDTPIALKSIWDSLPDSLCLFKNEAKLDTTKNSDNCLFVNISTASSLQLCVLKNTENEDVICMVNNYSAPLTESNITFYDKQWNRVGRQSFGFSDFSSDNSFQNLFVPALISALVTADDKLTITLSDENISDEDKKLITFPLTKELKWNGKRFE